jgi:hypothetical protein
VEEFLIIAFYIIQYLVFTIILLSFANSTKTLYIFKEINSSENKIIILRNSTEIMKELISKLLSIQYSYYKLQINGIN